MIEQWLFDYWDWLLVSLCLSLAFSTWLHKQEAAAKAQKEALENIAKALGTRATEMSQAEADMVAEMRAMVKKYDLAEDPDKLIADYLKSKREEARRNAQSGGM